MISNLSFFKRDRVGVYPSAEMIDGRRVRGGFGVVSWHLTRGI